MIFYSPNIINEIKGVEAGFTYALRDKFNVNASIPGLNFGENTDVTQSVVADNFNRLNNEIRHTGRMALAEQVHESDTQVVSESGFYKGVDGLITTEQNLLIGIKAADCAALLMADREKSVIAAIHAGWRGAASNILPKAIEEMKAQGANTKNIYCYISACISLNNFEIGEEVAKQFPPSFIDRTIGKKPHLDLKKFLEQQLLDKGIKRSNIEIDSRCTINDLSFYSFRRERDKAGRMLAFIKQTRI